MRSTGTAAIWVQIPAITGNARQEIKMYWGKTGVASESSGPAVFNATNGYCSVMHMNGNVLDSTGSTSPVNNGATPTTAVIGSTAWRLHNGRHQCGEHHQFPLGHQPLLLKRSLDQGKANQQRLEHAAGLGKPECVWLEYVDHADWLLGQPNGFAMLLSPAGALQRFPDPPHSPRSNGIMWFIPLQMGPGKFISMACLTPPRPGARCPSRILKP